MTRQESFAIGFDTNDGFQYGIETSRVHVGFVHKVKFKTVSAGPPIMEMLSQPLPYTELLSKVSDRCIEMTMLLPGVKTRKLHRIGIISTTTVDDASFPPGIARLIDYIGRPWSGILDNYSIQITSEVGNSANWRDRCIHILSKPEDEDQLPTLKFDWQRTFNTGRPLLKDTLTELVEKARKAALAYFEDLAEGSRFDEDIIGKRS